MLVLCLILLGALVETGDGPCSVIGRGAIGIGGRKSFEIYWSLWITTLHLYNPQAGEESRDLGRLCSELLLTDEREGFWFSVKPVRGTEGYQLLLLEGVHHTSLGLY